VIERLLITSSPSHTDGGAVYVHYQLTPKVALAARSEYLSDHGGLYSGKTQALKETTATFEYRFSQGFLMREEFRRDWSNQPYFLSDTLGLLKSNQTTTTLGLVWWFGGKEGAW
jgi:Putative beta-barrel porin-2, OmpL-like. bbp2